MKKMILLLVLLVLVLSCSGEPPPSGIGAAEEVKSLRGSTEIPAGSNPTVGMDWKPEDASIARTFVHQPPLIPHDVAEYGITTSQNDCMDCHGEKDSDAPIPHKSHFTDRDGKVTKGVSSQWYFCNQCHVGQVDANPLVENTFKAK